MTAFIIGLGVTAAVIGVAESFKKIDLKLFASFNLAVIPFIYIGFSIHPHDLILTVPAALAFLALAYFGYKRNYSFTIVGLVFHGAWDILFPRASNAAPAGYDIFCITIDLLLAAYFYVRLRP